MQEAYTRGGDNSSPEEDDLARCVAKYKDVDAADKLYECHLNGVYHYFLRRTANVSDTEDLTADTFVRAIEGLLNEAWPGQPFRAWLFGIARNVYFEWLRSVKRRSALEQHSSSRKRSRGEHTDHELLGEILVREQEEILWALVGELPELDQQVLILRFVYDLSYAEVALQVGSTPAACKTRQYRALQKLYEKVRQAGLQDVFGIGRDRREVV